MNASLVTNVVSATRDGASLAVIAYNAKIALLKDAARSALRRRE